MVANKWVMSVLFAAQPVTVDAADTPFPGRSRERRHSDTSRRAVDLVDIFAPAGIVKNTTVEAMAASKKENKEEKHYHLSCTNIVPGALP